MDAVHFLIAGVVSLAGGLNDTPNLTTGALVILASRYGLPVSTTHVSVGALFGIGLTTGQANSRVVAGIPLSRLLTLPCAMIVGALVWRASTNLL